MRFLGKVIVTTDKRARVEEKPEVRKAGGVYYTPEYIVRYIVENTVGKLVEGKSPAQIAEMRFADIACGSGSFLLGVYDLLLRYHTKYYNENPDKAKIGGKGKKEQKADCVERDDGLHLSLQKKREILVNNIYGVDIDAQAVEVAQLSLYLKLLQDETPGSTREHQLEFHEALLPSLNRNIVCGNSLIGTDILDSQLFPSEEERKLNPMNFEDAFPHIFKRKSFGELKDAAATPMDFNFPGVPLHGSYSKKKLKNATKVTVPADFQGGFDVVVGNPPYGAELGARSAEYLRRKFITTNKDLDTYSLFIEQAINLVKPDGYVSMIVPTGWYSGAKFPALRKFIACRTNPMNFVNLPYDVFSDAWVDTTVFIFKKREQPTAWPRSEPCVLKIRTFPKRHHIKRPEELAENSETAEMTAWFIDEADIFLTYANSNVTKIVQKIRSAGKTLGDVADIQRGVTPFMLTEKPTHKTSHRAFNGTIRRYRYEPGEAAYIRFDDTLAEPKPEKYFKGARLLLRELISRDFELQAMRVDEDFVTNKSMQSILPINGELHLNCLLGLLNSKLMSWYFLRISNIAQRDDFPKIVLKETRGLPIPRINLENDADKSQHDRVVRLVEQMLETKKQLAAAQTEKDRTYYENKCASLDRQIEALVYDLYGLTETEIKIVEGATA